MSDARRVVDRYIGIEREEESQLVSIRIIWYLRLEFISERLDSGRQKLKQPNSFGTFAGWPLLLAGQTCSADVTHQLRKKKGCLCIQEKYSWKNLILVLNNLERRINKKKQNKKELDKKLNSREFYQLERIIRHNSSSFILLVW